jgi:hypothetical protein
LQEEFLSRVPIPDDQVHTISTWDDANTAAQGYEHSLRFVHSFSNCRLKTHVQMFSSEFLDSQLCSLNPLNLQLVYWSQSFPKGTSSFNQKK